MIDELLNALLPHRCCSCGEIGTLLCESCKINILEEVFLGCILCGQPCGRKGLCQQCSRSLPCEQGWCVGERSGALKKLIDEFKFSSSRSGAKVIVSLLDGVLPVLPADITVVGVPTAPSTIRIRGFDHIGLIVRGFASKRGLRIATPLVRLSSATLHLLPRKRRIELGPSLFGLSGHAVPNDVLLIDDIVTTGTTLRAAVKLLKSAGVKKVYVAVVARQPEK